MVVASAGSSSGEPWRTRWRAGWCVAIRLSNRKALRAALRRAFGSPRSHALPAALPAPPVDWRTDYSVLAEEAGLPQRDLGAAFEQLADFWRTSELSGG